MPLPNAVAIFLNNNEDCSNKIHDSCSINVEPDDNLVTAIGGSLCKIVIQIVTGLGRDCSALGPLSPHFPGMGRCNCQANI